MSELADPRFSSRLSHKASNQRSNSTGKLPRSTTSLSESAPGWPRASSVTRAVPALRTLGTSTGRPSTALWRPTCRRVERRHLRGGRRVGGVAVHGRGVLGPHFPLLGLGGRDRPHCLTQNVGRNQLSQLNAVGRDHRRGRPTAEPFAPEAKLSRPDSPVLDEPDVDEKMLSPSGDAAKSGPRHRWRGEALQGAGHHRHQLRQRALPGTGRGHCRLRRRGQLSRQPGRVGGLPRRQNGFSRVAVAEEAA
jgi:hypothetical protein